MFGSVSAVGATAAYQHFSSNGEEENVDVIPEEGDFRCSYGYTHGNPANEQELRMMVVRADKKLYDMKHSKGSQRL